MKENEMQELIEDAMSSATIDSGGNQFKNVGKELFNPKDVTGKTELSAKQINAMARLRFTARMLEGQLNPETGKMEKYSLEENINLLVDDIKLMAMSHKRKSRAEFIEVHKQLNSQPNLIPNTNNQPNTMR